MIDQPTLLGFPITPWLITFFACIVIILIGLIMLVRDIKNKDIKADADIIGRQSGFSLPDLSSQTTSAFGDKTEAMFGTTGTTATGNSYTVSPATETESFFKPDKTEAMFESDNTASFAETETESFGFTGTTSFTGTEKFADDTETFTDKTESMN